MAEKYLEMWKSLGMDIERHNQLLDVLGQYYGAIYLTQKNRPKAMGYFDFVVSEIHGLRIKELNDSRKAGKKVVGAFCIYAPEELAYAADATMVGLCGGADFSIPDAEAVIPQQPLPLNQIFLRLQTQQNLPIFSNQRPRRR